MELTVADTVSPAYRQLLREGVGRDTLIKKLGITKSYADSLARELQEKGFVAVSTKDFILSLPKGMIDDARIFNSSLGTKKRDLQMALGLNEYYIYLEKSKKKLVKLIRDEYFEGMNNGRFLFGDRVTISRILRANGLELTDALND